MLLAAQNVAVWQFPKHERRLERAFEVSGSGSLQVRVVNALQLGKCTQQCLALAVVGAPAPTHHHTTANALVSAGRLPAASSRAAQPIPDPRPGHCTTATERCPSSRRPQSRATPCTRASRTRACGPCWRACSGATQVPPGPAGAAGAPAPLPRSCRCCTVTAHLRPRLQARRSSSTPCAAWRSASSRCWRSGRSCSRRLRCCASRSGRWAGAAPAMVWHTEGPAPGHTACRLLSVPPIFPADCLPRALAGRQRAAARQPRLPRPILLRHWRVEAALAGGAPAHAPPVPAPNQLLPACTLGHCAGAAFCCPLRRAVQGGPAVPPGRQPVHRQVPGL